MIIDRWETESLRPGPVRIYPDGCRDVIWYRLPGQAPRWKLSSLDTSMRVLTGASGAAMRGFRLAPGTMAEATQLLAALVPETPDDICAIAGLAQLPADVDEMMQALRNDRWGSVAQMARGLGVSLRSLQRLSLAGTGQSPLFWLRLARLRRALADAMAGTPLAEAAAGAGFADQAHFTREASRFHGASPARLLADAEAMAAILAPGL